MMSWMFFGQFRKRRFRVEVIVFGQRADHLIIIGIAPIPAANRAAGKTDVGVMDNQLGIEMLAHAQAVATAACAFGIVEREDARFQFGQAVAAMRAGVALGKHQFGRVIDAGGDSDAVGDAQSRLKGFG